MLEIARGRTWRQHHTFLDSVDGPTSDLSHLTSVRSQIRGKTAVKNAKGIFEHPLVMEVTTSLTGADNSISVQTLTVEQTLSLEVGDYIIDMVGFNEAGEDEALLDPEPIKIINRPTPGTPTAP